MNWRERIERDPRTMDGKPHVRGTDIPVSIVLDDLVVCKDFQEVVACHPALSEEDVRACLAWAAECSHQVDAEASKGAPAGVAQEAVNGLPAPPPEKQETFMDYLLSMPDVGEDADFERPEPPAEGASAPRGPMLYDLLMLGPNVGEDSDFERRRHPPREQPEWDT